MRLFLLLVLGLWIYSQMSGWQPPDQALDNNSVLSAFAR